MTITARAVAADVLDLARTRKTFAADAIDEILSSPQQGEGGKKSLSPQDRRFVTQLVFGVLRRRGTLDALLTPFVNRPPHAVEPRVWDVLRLGAFQLAFLTQVPPHAAVHETVDLARHVGSPSAKGFVNGVLRRVAELVTPEFVDYAYSDTIPFGPGSGWAPSPPKRGRGGGVRGFSQTPPAVKVSPGPFPPHPSPSPPAKPGGEGAQHYRKLTRPILPDPDEDEIGYLAAGFSWPKWLAERWHARYGWDECIRLGFWFNAPPPLWLRVNKRHNDREAYRLRLAAALIDAEPGNHPQSLRLTEGAAVRDLPGYADGDFAVQDLSAMGVASALSPQPGMKILDLCAAPGGKTTHLAELMDGRGRIVACDIDPKRLDTVVSLCRRLGVTIVEPVLLTEDGDPPAGPFDAALVDVPCSNTGVLGRRPEVRWRLKPTEFEYLIRLQTRLLLSAIDRVRPGGTIVYSTCSIEPDENEGVVKAVRRGVKGLVVEAEGRAVPGRPADGGYWARLRKPE